MKRIINHLLVAGLSLAILQPVNPATANNLSPIRRVDEPAQENTSPQQEEAAQSTERTEENKEQDHPQEDTFGDFSDLNLDPANPRSLIQALKQEVAHSTINTQYINGSEDADDPQVNIYTLLNDGNNHYLTHSKPGYLTKSTLIGVEDGKVTQGYLPAADYLAKGSAELLNQEPDRFEGTAVQDFYTYAQNHVEELEATFIEDVHLEHNQDNLNFITNLNQAFLETVDQWLANEGVSPANLEELVDEESDVEIHENVIGYVLEGETGDSFHKLLQEQLQSHPNLEGVSQLLASGTEGMVILDFENGELAVALGPEKGQLDHYSRLESYQLLFPKEEEVLNRDQFQERVGINIFQELSKLGIALDE